VVEAAINAPGQMVRYARMLNPNVVVVTSIGNEHKKKLGPIEAIRTEKVEILRRDSRPPLYRRAGRWGASAG